MIKKNKKITHFEKLLMVLSNALLHKLVFLLLMLSFIVFIQQRITLAEILPIQSVKIEGEFNYLSRENLKQHALPYVQGGFFSVNLIAIRQALIEVPWVQDVSIRRQWPNGLSVRVMEKRPVAYWGEKSMLSSRADLFTPEKLDVNLKLPVITGPEGQHGFMLQELGRMQAWLTGTELIIGKIKQDARRSWVLYLMTDILDSSNFELRLGRAHQHERLHRFVEIYERRLKKHKQKVRHIDMRYTNGFAVAWQNQEA